MVIFTKTAEFFRDRLGKTRNKISTSLSSVLKLGRNIDENLLDEIERTLISDDIGVETTDKLVSDLRAAYARSRSIRCLRGRPRQKCRLSNPRYCRQVTHTKGLNEAADKNPRCSGPQNP